MGGLAVLACPLWLGVGRLGSGRPCWFLYIPIDIRGTVDIYWLKPLRRVLEPGSLAPVGAFCVWWSATVCVRVVVRPLGEAI